MRLIDADAFERNMQNEWERNEISNGEWIHFREMLSNEPTIEPERKTGKWKLCKEKSDFSETVYAFYECSNCEQLAVKDYDFCPYCGADMRGEEK